MSSILFKNNIRITLVLVPQDLRYGFNSLNAIAATCLNIKVSDGNDAVVFVSKSRNLCKVITCDEKGTVLITRRLHNGRYQELLAKVDSAAIQELSLAEFERYFDGDKIYEKRTSLL